MTNSLSISLSQIMWNCFVLSFAEMARIILLLLFIWWSWFQKIQLKNWLIKLYNFLLTMNIFVCELYECVCGCVQCAMVCIIISTQNVG